MITETAFASRAISFWQTATPTSEAFVRLVNSSLVKKQTTEVESTTHPVRRGLINETAFEAFTHVHSKRDAFMTPVSAISTETIHEAYKAASQYIKLAEMNANTGPLTSLEVQEVRALISNLEQYFWQYLLDGDLIFRPAFKGCGIIDSCSGDLRTKEILFEIKAGDRPFRSTDLRQLLVYCALELQMSGRTFQRIGLFNPRLGLSFLSSLDIVAFELAGKSVSDLLFDIIEFVSAAGVST